LSQQHSTMDLDLQSLINDELSRIKALALSIIAMGRSGGELESILDIDVSFQVDELAGMILEQTGKIREILGNSGMKVSTGKAQIQQSTQIQ